jgi:RHS repeat-associated protein
MSAAVVVFGRRAMKALAAVLATLSLSAGVVDAQQEVVKYYHLDVIGNVRAVSNQANVVIERHDYLPFGEECTTGPCANNLGVGAGQPRKFTGKERDQETGLDYFGARYYGSRIARFATVDPSMTHLENTLDPQRWNRYAYGRNNPLRFVDPDGRDWLAELFLGERGKDINTWEALTGTEAQAHYAKTAEEHPFIAGQTVAASTLFSGPLGEAVGGVMGMLRLSKTRGGQEGVGDVAPTGEAQAGDQPFVPAEYWQGYAPGQVSPGTTRMDHTRVSGRTGRTEESRVIYDEFGRQIYRVDKTDHMRPESHSNPHLHERTYHPTPQNPPYTEKQHNLPN